MEISEPNKTKFPFSMFKNRRRNHLKIEKKETNLTTNSVTLHKMV